jgi:hypothetical protein
VFPEDEVLSDAHLEHRPQPCPTRSVRSPPHLADTERQRLTGRYVRHVPAVHLEFVRLTQVPVSEVLALLNEPRNARHMPLSSTFDEESAARWVADKDAQWERNGYAPWAVLVNGQFAG